MICGLKWKTCDCPWFNYAAVENDRLMHMNVPRRPPHPNPALGYQEELDRRREQERRDENLARRIQVLGLDGDENDFVFRPPPPPPNFARHMANVLSGAGMLNPEQIAAFAPPPPPPPPPPAPPAVIHIPPAPANRQHSRELPLRHHSVASRLYNNRPTTRESERVVPRRISTNYETEAQRHRPSPVAASEAVSEGMSDLTGAQNRGVRRTGSRHSAMAGLTRGSGQGRVDEWRRHVGSD